MSVSELYIPTMGLPFLLEEICGPEKEYINGFAVAVYLNYTVIEDLSPFENKIFESITIELLYLILLLRNLSYLPVP